MITNHAISINLETKVLGVKKLSQAISINFETKMFGGQEIIKVTQLFFADDVLFSCNAEHSADNWHNSYPYFTNPLTFKRFGG